MAGKALRAAFATITICLLSVSTQSRAAESCKPLTLLTSINILPQSGNSAVIVNSKINGHDEPMLVDTGGVYNTISPKVVSDLDLKVWHSAAMMVTVTGDKTNRAASADSFTLGRLTAHSVDFMVSDTGSVAGSIAPELLSNYDVEFDFAGHKLNLLSPDRCPGHVIYWHASNATVVPIRVAQSGHIIVPVMLDGIEVDGLIDTGTSQTTLNQNIAEDRFGLDPGSADTPVTGHLGNDTTLKTYSHRFRQLTIGGIGVNNPQVDILPDMMRYQMRNAPDTGSHLSSADEPGRLPDLIVGMDILHHLHLYVAYKEKKLYATPATVQTSASANASK